jgi:hypothetical protein
VSERSIPELTGKLRGPTAHVEYAADAAADAIVGRFVVEGHG